MRDRVHATELPGGLAWVAERLGLVSLDGTIDVASLRELKVGTLLDLEWVDPPQLARIVCDLGALLSGTEPIGHGSAPTPAAVGASTPVRRRRRSTGPTKSERRHALSQRILVHLLEKPGSTLDEVAAALGEDIAEVRAASGPVDWLVLGDDELVESASVESDAVAETRVRARAAMQAAALITAPLSHQAYTSLVHEGRVSGPSVARIVQLFGTWTAACAEVGVRSGEPLRTHYTRAWTREDVLGHVERFLLDPRYRGTSHRWDEWRAGLGDAKVPSLGTVRNMLGTRWNDIRTAALRRMRARWAR